MTTYKVTFVNEEIGLNETIRVPEDQYMIDINSLPMKYMDLGGCVRITLIARQCTHI